MKVQAINSYNNYLIKKTNNRQTVPAESKMPSKTVYPASYAMINFRGRSTEKLWEEYNWYINHDKTPAIFSFLKIKEAPEVMDKFLTTILETTDRSRELISSIISNPRKGKDIANALYEVLPPESKNKLYFFVDSPYNKAYNNFMDWKFKDSHSIEELLKIRPDWRGSALLKKYKDLKGHDKLEIGNVPKEFPIDHLNQIVDYLSKQMEFGMKSKKKIESLQLDNRRYDFVYFTEGRSDKNVFGVFTPEGKKFVLKMSKPESRSLDAPFALGTLAKIDSYLTYNRSRNSAPLCYYNHDKNFSIYKYIEHIPTPYCTNNLEVIKNNMPDFGSLGLSYNDTVGEKNFFLLAPVSNSDLLGTEGFEDGVNRKEWITVDNDHVTFSNIFQPAISRYHASLPNAMQMFF